MAERHTRAAGLATAAAAALARGFAEFANGGIALGLAAFVIAGASSRETVRDLGALTLPASEPSETARASAALPSIGSVPAPAPVQQMPPLPIAPASLEAALVPPVPAPQAARMEADPPVAEPPPSLKPAKVLFGSTKTPAPLAARAIGSYARGCLSGAKALPVDGPAWQAMRLSRNRHWGHPKLIEVVQRLAADGRENDGWRGLLVGDLAQPRGGPMLTGHASHQIGLDADIWLMPMPERRLSAPERESLSAVSLLAPDGGSVVSERWSEGHFNILKRAASYREVERVLVHPAIKQVLCYAAADNDRRWLEKVRPYWGHHYHFHIRIGCPEGSGSCAAQASVPSGDGCGDELDDWMKRVARARLEPALPLPPAVPPKAPPPMALDQLPAECRVVLETENPEVKAEIAAAEAAVQKAKAMAAAEKAATAKLGGGQTGTTRAKPGKGKADDETAGEERVSHADGG